METTPAPLLGYFDDLEDPRIDRTKWHALTEVLFIAIAGSIAGADGWRELEAFGHANRIGSAATCRCPTAFPPMTPSAVSSLASIRPPSRAASEIQ